MKWIATAAVLFVVAAGCDDAGVGARRALVERFSQRTGEGGLGIEAGDVRARTVEGRDWDLALLRHARKNSGLRWTAEVVYSASSSTGETARLTVKATLDQRLDGAFRAHLSFDYETPEGREGSQERDALWLDRLLYTSFDGGPYFARRSFADEHERWRAAPVDAVAGLLRALGEVSRVSAVEGRVGTYRLTTAPTPPSSDTVLELRERDDTWPLWFAARFRTTAISGHVQLTPDGDAPMKVELRYGGTATGDGSDLRLAVVATAQLAPLPDKAASWRPPAAPQSPVRSREHLRLRRILAPWLAASSGDEAP